MSTADGTSAKESAGGAEVDAVSAAFAESLSIATSDDTQDLLRTQQRGVLVLEQQQQRQQQRQNVANSSDVPPRLEQSLSGADLKTAVRREIESWRLVPFIECRADHIVVYDLESSVPPKDMIEFGAVVLDRRSFGELEEYSTLIQSERVTRESIKINGITAAEAAAAPVFLEIAPQIYRLMHQRVWMGHNVVRFDNHLLVRQFFRFGLVPPKPLCVVDTLGLLRAAVQDRAGDLKMATLSKYFSLGVEQHRALPDVKLTIEVLKRAALTVLLETGGPPRRSPGRPKSVTRPAVTSVPFTPPAIGALSPPISASDLPPSSSRRLVRPPNEPDADPAIVNAIDAAIDSGTTIMIRYEAGKDPLVPRPVLPRLWVRPASLFLATCLNSNMDKHFCAYKPMLAIEAHGTCDPIFEPVRQLFIAEITKRRQAVSRTYLLNNRFDNTTLSVPTEAAFGGGACALVVGDYIALSLWAGDADAPPKAPRSKDVSITIQRPSPSRARQWKQDTLVNVYSCSKGVTAMVISKLVELRKLYFDKPVSWFWSAFGASGKSAITLSDLMSHTAGLAYFDAATPLSLRQLQSMSRAEKSYFLARQHPKWPLQPQRHAYHALSIGLYADMLACRVAFTDIRGLYSQFFGSVAEFHFGVDVDDSAGVTPRLARINLVQPEDMDNEPTPSALEVSSSTCIRGFTSWRARHDVIPSAVGMTSALDLAQLYSAFARGESILPATRDAACAPHSFGQSLASEDYQTFTKAGFMRVTSGNGPVDENFHGVFFHPGMGGSVGFGDSELGFGLSFVTNILLIGRDASRSFQEQLIRTASACVKEWKQQQEQPAVPSARL